MEGRAQRGELREITMEDLLAREPMDVDEVACRKIVEGRVVLITGAAGSIGAELTRKVFSLGPSALHLIDMNETGLHELRVEMNQKSGGKTPVKPWLCNISDLQKLNDIFESSRPQVVFHLGAYKHIGMMEENPDQAFETNVLGHAQRLRGGAGGAGRGGRLPLQPHGRQPGQRLRRLQAHR